MLRVQQACGYEFTNKLHRMFTDVSLRNDLNGKFAEYVNDCETDLGLTFSVMVLQVTTTLTAIVVVVVSVVVILLEQLIPPPVSCCL